MIALLLIGALLFPLFSRSKLEQRASTKVLLGAVFGITFAALSLNSIVMDDGGVLNASAGVLIFSAYLGGPISGIITLLISMIVRIGFGGEFVLLALVMQTSYMFAGLLLLWRKPFTVWPQLPKSTLPWALSTFIISHLIGIAVVLSLGLTPHNAPDAAHFMVFTLMAALSIVITWLVIRQSWRLAAIERENASLLRKLHMIFENCGIGVFHYDGTSGKVAFEASFLKLYGLPENESLQPEEFITQHTHPDDQQLLRAYVSKAVQGDATRGSNLFRLIQNDDQLRYMQGSWQLESETSEGQRNLIGLHMDVTEAITAQQQRNEAQQQIAAIAENLPGVIFQLIWQGSALKEMKYVSPKSFELWGLRHDELNMNPHLLAEKFEPGEAAKASNEIRKVIRNNGHGSIRAWMRGAGDKQICVELLVQAVDLDDGTHLVNGIFVDVTKEVVAQQEADLQANLASQSQKNESIGRLTGGVAHDFNNILAVILSNLELLRDSVDSENQRSMIDASISASQQGATLTRSMLSFARTARLEPEVLDMNAVVGHAKNWMRLALPESIELEMSMMEGLWPVKLDESSLESALLNLMVNARDAMNSHGRLTISTENVHIDKTRLDTRKEAILPGNYVMLAVSDTGTGIDERTLECMFDPFYTTKPQGEGSGIGLSMVQGFVKQSLGAIHVHTEPGKGTSFKLYFPCNDTAAVETPVKATMENPAGAGEGRILLVEDNTSIRDVQLIMLERAGYHVVTAESGDKALEIFNNDPSFDLIITDIVMPGHLQGNNLARKIRETHPQVPFIFMSGYAAKEPADDSDLRSDEIRLMKPVFMSELMSSVATMLKQTAP